MAGSGNSPQGLQPTQPSDSPLFPLLSPNRGLTRAGHTPGRGVVSRPLSSPLSPYPPWLPWSAPSTPSCSQSFCPGFAQAGPAQEEDQRDRVRRLSVGGGKRGSPGVWLPSLPSPEEALENTDNKNSCSPAKRKCHFYPGLVLGTTGATSPMGSGARGSSGGTAGEHSLDPKTKGQRVRGTHRSLGTKLCNGEQGRNRLKSSCCQRGRANEMDPRRLAAQPLTQRLPGNAARPAWPAQSRYRRGLGILVWASQPAPTPSPTPLSQGESPQPTAYRPPPPPVSQASAPPSAPQGPHVKPGDPLRARAEYSSGWDDARPRDWARSVCDSLPGAPLATPLLLG